MQNPEYHVFIVCLPTWPVRRTSEFRQTQVNDSWIYYTHCHRVPGGPGGLCAAVSHLL